MDNEHTTPPNSEPHAGSIPLAIVGLGCRFPGADDLDGFWDLISRGGSDLGELPPERFNRDLAFDPERGKRAKSYSSIGGVCRPLPFDPERCPVPREMVKDLDEAHLSLCSVAADACRSGGLDPFNLPDRRAGVYVGHTRGTSRSGDITYATLVESTAQYLREIDAFRDAVGDRIDAVVAEVVDRVRRENPRRDADGGPDLGASLAAGLISKAFGLDGPYCALNAACASSLQALAIGARALQLGQIDMAIAGGASYCKSDSLVLFSQARSVTETGSRPFDADADGLVTSEGFVVVILKTLEKALADNNEVFAVIRGVGVSSDGRGKSLWAPRKEGQIEAIRRAYGPGVDMQRLQYVEAHATSTQVGDATEIAALAEAMRDQLPAGQKLPIGSVKANVGHTLESAGMAGLVKTILAMRNRTVPGQINLRNLNPKIDWDSIPFFVPTRPTHWDASPDGHPRRAAVNAFGIGGLNVHIVVDEFLPEHARRLVAATPLPDAAHPIPPTDRRVEPIAIVGAGAVLPGARTFDSVWKLFESGQPQFVDLPEDRWDPRIAIEPGSRRNWRSPTGLAGCVTDFAYDWKRHKVPPKQIAAADPLQFMLLDAVDQAFTMSGYHEKPFDRKRTGVLVGSVFGGEFSNQLQMGLRLPDFGHSLAEVLRPLGVEDATISEIQERYGDLLVKRMPALEDETGSFTTSTLASRITKSFDLMGGAAAIDGHGPSAFAALSACVDLLRIGDVDMMVCAAGQCSLGLPLFEGMSLSGTLAGDNRRGPFDAEADGYLPGEGVGVVLLKRLSDAQRDGDQVLGIVHGVGVARADSLPESIERGARRCLQRAGVTPQDVTCVEAGSPGLATTDHDEIRGLAAAYAGPREAPLVVGSAAGQIGYTGGASGMVSLLKGMLELEHLSATPNVGLNRPAAYVAQQAELALIDPEAQPIPVTHPDGRLFAAIDSFGKWNLAYHVLIERPTRVPNRKAPATHQPATKARVTEKQPVSQTRIVRCQAPSLEQLLATTEAIVANVGESFEAAGLPDASRVPATSRPHAFKLSSHRLAVVAADPDELADKLTRFAQVIRGGGSVAPLADRGVFYGQPLATRPRVAFLFSGQGSQYTDMLKRWVDRSPLASNLLATVDDDLRRLGYPSFAEFAWGSSDALGRDVFLTQLSLLVADTVLHRSLTSLGVVPDRVAGHSYGEFPALVAAEAWSFADAARATDARCRSVQLAPQTEVAMLAIAASADVVDRHLDPVDGVFVTHRNSPRQTVACGELDAINTVETSLARAGFESRRIPVPRPFHTPLLAAARGPFAKALRGVPIDPPRTPLLSSVTNRYVADPSDIRRNLAQQLVTPVRYGELIERLHSEGVRVFVEVGPRQVLTGLHRQILDPADTSIVGCDHPKRDGIAQQLHVLACYEAAGAGASTIAQTMPTPSSADTATRYRVDGPEPQTGGSGGSVPKPHDRPLTSRSDHAIDPSDQPRGSSSAAVAEPEPYCESRPIRRNAPSPTADAMSTAGASPTAAALPAADTELATVLATGVPYDRGLAHGAARKREIRSVLRSYADTPPNRLVDPVAVARVVSRAHEYFDESALEEIRGIAAGAGVSPEALIAHNVRIYPDLAAGCCHFAVKTDAKDGHDLLHGANEDLPLGLLLRGELRRHIQVTAPVDGRRTVTFPIAGQVGALSGINDVGIAVTSAMLLDLPRRPGDAPGRLHGLIVRDILHRATDVDSAIAIACEHAGIGSWAIAVSHAPSDSVALIEYDGANFEILRDRRSFVAANHTLRHRPRAETPSHSRTRLERLANQIQSDGDAAVDENRVRKALRDRFDMRRGREVNHPTMNTVRRVDNQLSVLFRPAAGLAWLNVSGAHPGSPDRYLEVDLRRLFESSSPTNPAAPKGSGDQPAAVPDFGSAAKPDDRTSETPVAVISPNEFAHLSRSVDGGPPITRDRNDICQRFVMRMAEGPRPDIANEMACDAGAVILGNNPLGHALAERLRSDGGDATIVPSADDPVEAIRAIDETWQTTPPRTLILATPFDSDATNPDADSYAARRHRGVLTPYAVVQHWYRRWRETKDSAPTTLVACTAMGGDFGFSGATAHVEGGALTGLLKAVRIEVGRVGGKPIRVRTVDLSSTVDPHRAAEIVRSEMTSSDEEVEVGYPTPTRRLLVRPVVEPAPKHVVTENPTPERPDSTACQTPRRGDVWVVTGGARGVTAVVARELGRRYGLNLHLIGSTRPTEVDPAWRNLDEAATRELRARVMKEAVARDEVPLQAWSAIEKGIEIDRNLQAFRDAGVQAEYHACDVSDRAALSDALDQIRTTSGPITGVLHGAGFERACRFDRKQPELVERTLAAKVDAAIYLADLLRDDPLTTFLAFGSISGRFGGNGQTDYCLANDLLAKWIDRFRKTRPDCRAALFHWHSWDEVGMAVRPESKHIKQLLQFRYMPTREGVDHVVRELLAGLPEGEVLITDWSYYKRYFPDGELPPDDTAPRKSSNPANTGVATSETEIAATTTRVAHRHVLRIIPAPTMREHDQTSASRSEDHLHSPAIVFGDGEMAQCLANAIARRGQTAHLVSPDSPLEELLATFDRIWESTPAAHLFLTSPRDLHAKNVRPEDTTRRIEKTFRLAQRWARRISELDASMPMSLVAVTSLGGDFGFTSPIASPEGGAAAGLLKSVYVESRRRSRDQLTVKVIDAPTDEPADRLAENVLDELAGERHDVEVAFRDGKRFVVRADYTPVAGPELRDQLTGRNQLTDGEAEIDGIRAGGTWILTGGARGITAQVGLELGRRHRLRLHLIGRHDARPVDPATLDIDESTRREWKRQLTREALAAGDSPTRRWQNLMKDVEIARTLRDFEREGIDATYHACDIADQDALQDVLRTIREQSGPIEGIVHGAGVRTPARFEKVTAEELSMTLGAKVEGTLNLLEATRQDPLGYFIGFGSVGGRFGTNGGTLYALGNETVAKLCGWLGDQRPDVRTACLHWHGWGEVGMMTGGASFGAQGILNMNLMPPREGVRHLLDELSAGLPEREVLYTDGELHRLFYPADAVRGTPRTERSKSDSAPAGPAPAATNHAPPATNPVPNGKPASKTPRRPLIDSFVVEEQGRRIVTECELDPAADPFLLQHRFRDRPLLPIVIVIEMMAEAASCFDLAPKPVTLEQIEILNGWRFFNETPQTAKVIADRDGDAIQLQLVGDFRNRAGKMVQPNRVYARAMVSLQPTPPLEQVVYPATLPPTKEVLFPAEREEVLYHGPIFRTLESIHCRSQKGLARITAPQISDLAGHRERDGWLHSPATLDSCLFACGIYPWFHEGGIVAIPHTIERLALGDRLPYPGEACLVCFNYLGQSDSHCSFNFTLYGADRQPLLRAEGFHASIISGKSSVQDSKIGMSLPKTGR